MKAMLLAAAGAVAALALYAVPAAAEDGFSGSSRSGDFVGRTRVTPTCDGVRSFRHNRDGDHSGMRRDGDRRAMRRDGCRSDVIMDWYGGEWALYNNRSWNSDSYNDWWHDRPDRAYPAWMRNNQGCSRMWYAADTLRC
jgi:hypothetical protein